jgi:hypothetical protein
MKINTHFVSRIKRFLTGLLVSCLYLSVASQTDTSSTPTVQISDISWIQDTSKANMSHRDLSFNLIVQKAHLVKSISIKLLDINDSVISDLGSYDVKQHSHGFLYIENSAHHKKTITHTSIYFREKIMQNNTLLIRRIELTYRTEKEEKTIYFPI